MMVFAMNLAYARRGLAIMSWMIIIVLIYGLLVSFDKLWIIWQLGARLRLQAVDHDIFSC